MKKIRRPVLRYFGGKWRLALWVISYFPEHKIYVEPYGGAASVLLQKPRSSAEIYNDMDGDIVNLFKILRDREIGPELARQIALTPFSRQEYELSYQPANNLLEQARRTIVRSFMGFSSDSVTRNYKTGFRTITKNSARNAARNAAREWVGYPGEFIKIIERLREVVIENLPALDCMAKYDSPGTLHYIDPPYLIELYYKENGRMNYRFEMTEEQHISLLKFIQDLKGMRIISHYPNKLYEEMLSDWKRVETLAVTQSYGSNGKSWKHETEVLWISPNAVKRLPLFDDLNSKPIERIMP